VNCLMPSNCAYGEGGRRAPKNWSAFQIRSSWAHFLRRRRFVCLEKSISCVFSTCLNIPTPPASTISLLLFAINRLQQLKVPLRSRLVPLAFWYWRRGEMV